MSIQLIQETERLSLTFEGSTIFYQRLPAAKRATFVRRATKKGVTDMEKVAQWGLEYCVLGWENVKAGDKEIPFSVDLIAALPQDAREEIADKAFIGGLEEETGTVTGDDSPLAD